MTKVSDLDPLAIVPDGGDYVIILDVSDTTQGPTGSLKRVLVSDLLAYVSGVASATYDVITEYTPDTGVTVEGVLIKDSTVTVASVPYDISWESDATTPTRSELYNKFESLTDAGTVRTIVIPTGNTTLGGASGTDYVCFVDGAYTISLPNCSGNTNRYTIKNISGGSITVNSSVGDNINGSDVGVTLADTVTLELISTGTSWLSV